jgi:hypothetical protein
MITYRVEFIEQIFIRWLQNSVNNITSLRRTKTDLFRSTFHIKKHNWKTAIWYHYAVVNHYTILTPSSIHAVNSINTGMITPGKLSYNWIPYHIDTIPHWYHTIPYHTIPYHTIPQHTLPYHTISYHTILYHIIVTIPYHAKSDLLFI